MAVPARLYLDTARLGLMSPSAQLAAGDFARLAGEGALGLYSEEFLAEGAGALPDADRQRFDGIRGWSGVRGLASDLRTLVGAAEDSPVWLASRSISLMRFAARLLCDRCDRILTTDTLWSPYRRILQLECARRGRELVEVPIRATIQSGNTTALEIIARITNAGVQYKCDGLFMTAISNDGIRLPVSEIVQRVEYHRPLRFTAIDGAQQFGHAEVDLLSSGCDFYLAGCHKWLCAYQPMGLAFCGRHSSRGMIERHMRCAMTNGTVDDPLLRFSRQLITGELDGISETVNVAPLFTCYGALQDVPQLVDQRARVFSQRLNNVEVASFVVRQAGWRPLLSPPEFQSGILLIRADRQSAGLHSAQTLRSIFREFGVAVTTYDHGLVRLSMPGRPWLAGELDQINQALCYLA